MITREEFMEFFRSEDFHSMTSTEDCIEVFSGVMKGSSDFTADLINDVLSDYGNGNILAVKSKKTYYLLGSEAVEIFENEGVECLIFAKEDNQLNLELFVFDDGVTPSHELAAAVIEWDYYSILTEDEYNQLSR